MVTESAPQAHPPETLEGWFALHQVFSAPPSHDADVRRVQERSAAGGILQASNGGWSAFAQLVGSRADILAVHFRPTLEELAGVQAEMREVACTLDLSLTYSFLSVTEAGLYHLTAQLARDAAARGGSIGDPAYVADL